MASSQRAPMLSKSRFTAGMKCSKLLWLRCHRPELGAPLDAATQARFDAGTTVGAVARQAFPGGVLVEADYKAQKEALAQTQALLSDSRVPAIFEAAFCHDGVQVRVDILERATQRHWRLIEVKSTTCVKEEHSLDAAIQQYVVGGCGIQLEDVCVMHLNNQYTYNGGDYDLPSLFTIATVSGQTTMLQPDIPHQVTSFRTMLASSVEPVIPPGEQCATPYACEFAGYCGLEKPSQDWIGFLPGLRTDARRRLEMRGVASIHAIPDDFPLTNVQRRVCRCVRSGEAEFGDGLATKLKTLSYPRYFLDFETVNPALPRFAGMKPFSQIPFQWSLHIQPSPGILIKHVDFLSDDGSDPRQPFIESLLSEVGEEGPIITYNATFEKTRLRELADWLPQYRAAIEAIITRIWDLLPVMRNHVYHPAFFGSFSLKYVLPALITGMSYTDMEVADGVQAGLAYDTLVARILDQTSHNALRQALLDYCEQDTLAMVRLIEHLEGVMM